MASSFRALLDRAIRTDEEDYDQPVNTNNTNNNSSNGNGNASESETINSNNNNNNNTTSRDWSPHTIDYAGFKHMLKAMARRRAKLRKMIRQETDQKLPEPILQQALEEFLTPACALNHTTNVEKNHQQHLQDLHHHHLPPQFDPEANPNDTSFMSTSTADSSQIPILPPSPIKPGPGNGGNGTTTANTTNTTATTGTSIMQPIGMKPSRSWKAHQLQTKSQTSLSIQEEEGEGEEDQEQQQQHQQQQEQQQPKEQQQGEMTMTTPYLPFSDTMDIQYNIQTNKRQLLQQQQQQRQEQQQQQQQQQHFQPQCEDPFSILLEAAVANSDMHNNDDASSMQSGSMTSSFASHSTAAKRRARIKRKSKRNVLRKISTQERSEMVSFLQHELNKVQMFYLAQWQVLSHKLEEFSMMTTATIPITNQHSKYEQQQQQQNNDDNANNDHDEPPQTQPSPSYSSYYLDDQVLGQEILELFAFCTMNIVATCQILIRYDAYARTFEGTPMMEYFLKLVTKHPTAFRKILQHEELSALADSYQLVVGENNNTTNTNENGNNHANNMPDDNATNPSILMTSFEQQRQMFKNILDSTYSAQAFSSLQHGQDSMTDSFIRTLRSWVEFGAYEDRLGLEPAYLTMRGKSLTQEMKQLAEWRERQQQLLRQQQQGQSPDAAATQTPVVVEEPPKPKLSDVQKFNLTLNLMSAFLYCMNYYIVEPSSTMYVNRLGSHDAMSGTLIGMMPLAAFLSSIPFSMWTNHSFRQPFLMSCTLLVIGNLLYSLADQVRMVEVALVGRFIAGLGAPKCIIRRYMADTTPVRLRTGVNAGFGMVVAAGSALGPAMAVLLNRIEYMSDPLPVLGVVFFNGLTMPGYFMAALWTTFLLIMLLTLDEPHRAGLAEQVQMEMMSKKEKDEEENEDDESMEEPLRPTTYEPPGVFRSDQGASMGGAPDDIHTIFSKDTDAVSPLGGDSSGHQGFHKTFSGEMSIPRVLSASWSETPSGSNRASALSLRVTKLYRQVTNFVELITFPVRICLGLLFAKVFTIEALASATSALSKNRYHWQVRQVGMLGFTNGCLVIPFSILVGRLSLSYQDQKLMFYLVAIGCFGFFLLVDLSDLVDAGSSGDYNKGHPLAVGPRRYVTGYFLSYLSIQAFEGVIGSTLSKVIPTALASGTFNSGLLATLVDTAGRACGDLFISAVGFISLRQLMNLLFIPAFGIMLTCLIVIERNRDLLAV